MLGNYVHASINWPSANSDEAATSLRMLSFAQLNSGHALILIIESGEGP